MKTAILQCLQQFFSKNSKNDYHDQMIKKLKLQCHCKIVQNVQVETNVFHKFVLLDNF